jgi:UDP-N-acetyl-D-glucosamine dehydrogenase
VDFFLAYSPEREDPGNPDFDTASIPKVVGGADPVSAELAEALYDEVVVRTVRVSSARAAEATKLMENIFRAVNIALVNERKGVYERLGIDIWEVLDAAATKPFGFLRFTPGPGWGGHCIPIDPFYLSWKARQHGLTPRFIELAGEVNLEMPLYVVNKLEQALQERNKVLEDSRILLLGIAYKKDVADPRESPAFEILSHLLQRGAEVGYHDPLIPDAPAMRSWEELPRFHSHPLTREVLAEQDAVILVTDHSSVDYDLVLEHADCIVDTRGVYQGSHPNVVKA